MSQRRIAVTGMSVVTPIGETVDSFWDNLLLGRSGVRDVTLFDTTGFDVQIGLLPSCHRKPGQLIVLRIVWSRQ